MSKIKSTPNLTKFPHFSSYNTSNYTSRGKFHAQKDERAVQIFDAVVEKVSIGSAMMICAVGDSSGMKFAGNAAALIELTF